MILTELNLDDPILHVIFGLIRAFLLVFLFLVKTVHLNLLISNFSVQEF